MHSCAGQKARRILLFVAKKISYANESLVNMQLVYVIKNRA